MSLEAGELGPKARAALRDGATFGNDDSRSAALMTFLVGAVNAGWSDNDITRAVFDSTNRGGEKIREIAALRNTTRAMVALNRRVGEARQYVQRNHLVLDANGARFKITDWIEHVERQVWKGAAGLTDRIVLRAVGAQAQRTTSATRVPMSTRALAETCGIHRNTAGRSLKRCCALGWLTLEVRTDGAHPAKYSLRIPKGCELAAPVSDTVSTERSGAGGSQGDASHDAWRRSGLGKGPQRVYALLQENLAPVSQISSHLQVSRSVTHRHLRLLRQFGLVENRDGCWSVTDRSLDHMLDDEFPHLVGFGAQQAREHDEQRQRYRQYQQRRTA